MSWNDRHAPIRSRPRAHLGLVGKAALLWLAATLWAVTGAAAELRAARGPDGTQRAQLVLDSYAFRPERLVVEAQGPVELTLVNVAILVPHNFVLDAPGSGLAIRRDVGPGETAILRFTPRERGTFAFYCDKKLLFLPSHRDKGMQGSLEVR